MIAHRLSTLDACDMLLEIEHGRITHVDRGHARQRSERALPISG